ncbi:hypothetical protein GQR58_021887 [Nymphon striatum]|nr:hypothetical protein GQR58_021887 [Nymphon striatum]
MPIEFTASDKSDPLPPSPAHFLIGRNLQVTPEVDNATGKTELGKRWKKDYLLPLNKFRKWVDLKNNLKIGDVVLIAEHQLKKCQWKMGKVHSAVVKTKDGMVQNFSLEAIITMQLMKAIDIDLNHVIDKGFKEVDNLASAPAVAEVLTLPPQDTSRLAPCKDEEVDLRIYVHLNDVVISQNVQNSVIKTVDTDVVVLGVAAVAKIPNLQLCK